MTLRIINDFEEEETRACFKEPLSNEPDKYHDEPHSGNQNKRRDDKYVCVCVCPKADSVTASHKPAPVL